MTYVPQRVVRVTNNQLTESTDLTVSLSAFQSTESYLVVTQNSTNFVVSLSQILLLTPGLDLTQPVATGLATFLTDQFVARFGVDTLPLTNAAGTYTQRFRVFDGLGYKTQQVHYTSVNQTDQVDDARLKGSLDDLAITSQDDLSQCLVAVNGVFHKTSFLNDTLYVLDGFRTMRIANRKDVTLVDTSLVGGHSVIPITSSMVSQSAVDQDALITLPQSIQNKTVFLVVDGYFYHMDSGVLQIADSTHIKVHTNKMDLIAQFRHNPRTLYTPDRLGVGASQQSTKYTDAYATAFLNQRQVATTTFQTPAFQMSRLSAYHSFLVVMNTSHLYTKSTPLIPTGTPQFYTEPSQAIVSGMMSYGCGLCPSYLISQDPFNRKSIFINSQDNDSDLYHQSVDPVFIPALIPDVKAGTQIPARLVDYMGTPQTT